MKAGDGEAAQWAAKRLLATHSNALGRHGAYDLDELPREH